MSYELIQRLKFNPCDKKFLTRNFNAGGVEGQRVSFDQALVLKFSEKQILKI